MADAAADPFHRNMERLNVRALWEVESHGNRRNRSDSAMIWRWAELDPLIEQAIEAVGMADADRRVLAFIDPDKPDVPGPTPMLNAALQILMPGEHAPAHRHSMNALRFVMEGSGATTIVDGKRCTMEEGDLILTPGWTWHEHVHEGKGRMIWLDALDVPLHRYMGTTEFQPGPVKNLPPMRDDDEFATAGMVPAGDAAVPGAPYSPMFRYPWAEARAALRRLPADSDGSRTLRYVNPLTGGAVMSLIDCYLLGLAKSSDTVRRRSSASTICLVADGEGVSRIGEDTIEWRRNDVFTVPRKNWFSHRATSDGATLFLASDRDALAKLGLLKDERDAA
jgi:gentisate 1,2-dioxygenase